MYESGPFIIICAGATLSLLIFFGFIVLMRYINYKETLTLAEKGLMRPVPEKRRGKGLLIGGVMVTAIGLALCLGLYPLGLMGNGTRFPLGLGPWMIGGFLPLFIGIGLVLVYIITGNDNDEKTRLPKETPETSQPSSQVSTQITDDPLIDERGEKKE